MTVSFDAQGSADATANGATALNFTNLTITAALVKSALVAALSVSNQGIASLTVTWDNGGTNQAMTQIIAQNDGGGSATGRAILHGLVAPTSGNKTLRAAWTGASDIYLDALSCSGADQTGGTTTFANASSNSGGGASPQNPTVAVSSAVGNLTVAVLCASDNGTINSVTQTQVYIDNLAATISGDASRAVGADSVTHGCNISGGAGNINWGYVGVNIVAAAVGANIAWTTA